jgi:hypothetical protein
MQRDTFAEPNFLQLGHQQKHILRFIVEENYYILKTIDLDNLAQTIELIDVDSNIECMLLPAELKRLCDRNILASEDVSKSMHSIQEKFYIPEDLINQVLQVI